MLDKYTERLKQINHYIKQKSTGCPSEFARKLGINIRTWYKWRNILINDLGLPIDYCPIRQTYFYKEEGTFEIGFKRISDYQTLNISEGDTLECIFQNYSFVSVRQFFVSRITSSNNLTSYLEIQLYI